MVAALKPGFTVRQMQEADVSDVIVIECGSYSFPWTEGIFKDCLRVGYRCLVLELNGVLAGYAILAIAAQECHILNFCIAREHRGCGMGRAFMEYLLEEIMSANVKVAHLEVRPSNIIANNLYISLGFEQIGIRKSYYPTVDGREDALILALTFQQPGTR